jgi:hypothetical protein
MKPDEPLANALAFDRSLYPRSYPMAPFWRILQYTFGVAFAAGGLARLVYLFSGTGEPPASGLVLDELFCLLFLGIGGYLVLDARKSKIVLSADSIELQQAKGTRRLARSEIAGRRIVSGQYGLRYTVLEPKPGQHLKALKIPLEIRRDRAFAAWLESFPNLDAADERQVESVVAADESLGTTPEERLRLLRQARKGAAVLNLAGLLLIYGVLFPPAADVAGAAAFVLPWVALVLIAWKPRLFSLVSHKEQATIGLSGLWIGPATALALHALFSIHLLHWQAGLPFAAAGAVVLGGIALRVDQQLKQRSGAALAFAGVMLAYGYGAGAELDTVPDRSAPQWFQVKVDGKHVSHGRKTTWYLDLAPWGPRTDEADVSVPKMLYQSLRAGDLTCVGLYEGALEAPWFVVQACPALRPPLIQ